MLDRMLGAHREAGLAGWAILLAGELALAAGYFLFVEGRTSGAIAPFAYAIGAWLFTGAVLMPVIGFIQGAPQVNDAPAMHASFFMRDLGLGAAAEALVAWVLFGAVAAAGRSLKVQPRVFVLAIGGAALAAVIAAAVPALVARTDSGRVVEGKITGLAGPVFVSVLELPQPPGAVLGPHKHIAGFVLDTSGTATMSVAGKGIVDVGPGDAFFTGFQQLHDHENRAAVLPAIGLGLVLVGLTVVIRMLNGRRSAVVLLGVLLVAGAVATVDPLMNHWYFIGVRPAAMRGAVMPVPAGHRTYESLNLAGLRSGPYLERLTSRRLGSGQTAQFTGPGAIVVLDGQAGITTGGHAADLSAQSGVTIAGGDVATVRASPGDVWILAVELLPSG
jgi:quercetin dioxygenase-like cupin family protein